MMNKIQFYTVTSIFFFLSASANAGETAETKIKRAMAAAPSAISAEATIIDSDGTILKQGSNGWTCLPDVMPGDKNPICNDAVWMKAIQALNSKAPFTTDKIGISYMLKGDFGAGVSNSDPYHTAHKKADDYVETGPHLMVIVPKEMLKGLPTDPSQGGPYVMWGDTPYAHIMIPIDDSKVLMPNHKH
ncbi:hypothetical protein tinsulaeT_38250 [Thalassotalea insulae]|uniref:Uncharacterized protein n=1 Tax=Thalassotalea insulae TaxID=2056778 RepID=A0ABQ6H147_9GAMM|nr:hypothetical protein [Thalassotalea insulae]GLX80485.1 hypothetical protein tinsulaeT_38250 [Thalassotalea insulae]